VGRIIPEEEIKVHAQNQIAQRCFSAGRRESVTVANENAATPHRTALGCLRGRAEIMAYLGMTPLTVVTVQSGLQVDQTITDALRSDYPFAPFLFSSAL
jgi:hypothetical protein